MDNYPTIIDNFVEQIKSTVLNRIEELNIIHKGDKKKVFKDLREEFKNICDIKCPHCGKKLEDCFGDYFFCRSENRFLCNECFNDVEDKGSVGTFIVCKGCGKTCYSD